MSQNIEHQGEVVDIDSEYITVEIISHSACASCSSKSVCHLGETESKIIQIPNGGGEEYEVGERVNVLLKRSMGYKALWLSYIVPLVIMMVLLLVLSALKVSEPVMGLGVLLSLALYYLGVYVMRNRIKKEIIFTIEKLIN